VVPADVAVKAQPHKLSVFPVASVVVLHYMTAGLFSVIYLNLLHDKMPRLRQTDPSGTAAIGLCFVPGVNLLWFFFTYYRLCDRINEQRRFNGLPETAPRSLSLVVAMLTMFGPLALVLPAPGLAGLSLLGLVVMPVFAAMVQHSVNELADQPVVPAISC
jgi:hypothetical protein